VRPILLGLKALLLNTNLEFISYTSIMSTSQQELAVGSNVELY